MAVKKTTSQNDNARAKSPKKRVKAVKAGASGARKSPGGRITPNTKGKRPSCDKASGKNTKNKAFTSKNPGGHPTKKLTGKQAPWFKAFIDISNPLTFLNRTQSAKAAGYKASSDAGFYQIGSENYRKLRPLIEKWLDEEGLSERYLKRKLISLIEAKETKFFQHEGIVTETREVEALGIQKSALDMAFKLNGMYAPEKHDHNHSGEVTHNHKLSNSLSLILDEVYDQAEGA